MPEALPPNHVRPEYMRIADLYDLILPEFPYAEPVFNSIANQIHQLAAQTGQFKVLEYGFGTGLLTAQIAADPRVSVIGVDPSSEFYPKALERTQDMPNVQLVQADATKYQSATPVNVVTATFAYHHIPDNLKPDLIRSAASNLTPNGKLILGDEFLGSYSDGADKIQAIQDFYLEATAYLKKSGASHETIMAFSDSLQSSLDGIEEFKVSIDVLEQQLLDNKLKIEHIEDIWPGDGSDYGCKIVTAIK